MEKTETQNPRETIEELVSEGDLDALLERAAEVHGHICPGLAAGVKAAFVAAKRLGLENEGMEDVMAEVECNNCFVDGIQVVSGCTLGNNALIYRDLGKTAVTFYRRGEDEGLRLLVREMSPGIGLDEEGQEEADELFTKAVRERQELTEAESRRFRELWRACGRAVLDLSEEEYFKIETVQVEEVSYAPIFDSATCSLCGEDVMETRARLHQGKPVCLSCAEDVHWLVHGAGIFPAINDENEERG